MAIDDKYHPQRQPCWDCTHSTLHNNDGYHCPWAWSFKPVPGWDAVETTIKSRLHVTDKTIKAYRIMYCPNYEWDGNEYYYKEQPRDRVKHRCSYVPVGNMSKEEKIAKRERDRAKAAANADKPGYRPDIIRGRHSDINCKDCKWFIAEHKSDWRLSGKCTRYHDKIKTFGGKTCPLADRKEENVMTMDDSISGGKE